MKQTAIICLFLTKLLQELFLEDYHNSTFCLRSILFCMTQDYQVIDKVWIIKDKHGPEAWEAEEEGETVDVGKVSELHVTSVE